MDAKERKDLKTCRTGIFAFPCGLLRLIPNPPNPNLKSEFIKEVSP